MSVQRMVVYTTGAGGYKGFSAPLGSLVEGFIVLECTNESPIRCCPYNLRGCWQDYDHPKVIVPASNVSFAVTDLYDR